MWWRLQTAQVLGSVASMHSQSERRLTLKMRDPYPNTTNGEGVITLQLCLVGRVAGHQSRISAGSLPLYTRSEPPHIRVSSSGCCSRHDRGGVAAKVTVHVLHSTPGQTSAGGFFSAPSLSVIRDSRIIITRLAGRQAIRSALLRSRVGLGSQRLVTSSWRFT